MNNVRNQQTEKDRMPEVGTELKLCLVETEYAKRKRVFYEGIIGEMHAFVEDRGSSYVSRRTRINNLRIGENDLGKYLMFIELFSPNVKQVTYYPGSEDYQRVQAMIGGKK